MNREPFLIRSRLGKVKGHYICLCLCLAIIRFSKYENTSSLICKDMQTMGFSEIISPSTPVSILYHPLKVGGLQLR